MKFGFHVSIGSGLSKVFERAQRIGCHSIQIFTRNPRGWKYHNIPDEEIISFKKRKTHSGIDPIFVHLPYLPNLASHKHPLYEASISSLKEEMKRAHLLGIKFVIAHTGKSTSSDKKSATQQIIKALNESLFCVDNGVIILLENTAGQGSEIGNRIEELGEIMDKITIKNRIGLCLDTAHAFQAGYKINEMEGLNMLIEKIDARIGIEKLFVLHLNDSKTPCGSRIDRHWHIGKGEIGVEGFRNIVNHPLLSHLPGIMETPRSGDADDIKNMKTIKSLVC